MEMIYMEAKLFMKMMERFEVFASEVNTIVEKTIFEVWNHDLIIKMYACG